MSSVCSYCGCSEIEYDAARGDAVCTSCGSVLEDNIIVSEVNFQEQSSGASTVVGQFVSDGARPSLSGSGFSSGLVRDSREATLQSAKRRITDLGNALKLNQHCIDTAFRFFKMALNKNLTRGRKSALIDTACLYLVCRTEGTSHLLLDFSDIQGVSVYALGRAYLRLSSALHINPPALDPCLYIHRFAHKLEFGDKVKNVSESALRLVSRMKRDWIAAGRRPSGLCGAAILIAARSHNFNRSVRDVARIVRVNDQTIRKRLYDFRDTPSSSLTISQFMEIDLEQEHDPPSFMVTKRKPKTKLDKMAQETEEDSSSEGEETKEGAFDDEEDPGEFVYSSSDVTVLPVADVIARARIEEMFNSVPTAGLTGGLEELAYLGREQMEQEEQCGAEEESGALDLEGIDDEEIDKMLLNDEEIKAKTALWMTENGEYLKEMEERKRKQEEQRLQKEGRKKKQFRKKAKRFVSASSAGEATQKMLVEKKISNKINYDVLKDLMEGNNLSNKGEDSPQHQHLKQQSSYPSLDQSEVGVVEGGGGYTTSTPMGLPSMIKQKRPLSPCGLTRQPKLHKTYSEAADEEVTLKVGSDLDTPGMEVVVETGPVCNLGDEVIESGTYYDDDEDDDVNVDGYYDDMAYPGDPLLNSDGEDDDEGY